MVELGPGIGTWRQPAHRPAGARHARGGRQAAIVRPRAGTALDDPARARIRDDLVTPRRPAERLGWRHEKAAAEILREYGPFPGVDQVGGVSFDGRNVWFAAGDKLQAFDPANGK